MCTALWRVCCAAMRGRTVPWYPPRPEKTTMSGIPYQPTSGAASTGGYGLGEAFPKTVETSTTRSGAKIGLTVSPGPSSLIER